MEVMTRTWVPLHFLKNLEASSMKKKKSGTHLGEKIDAN